MNATNKEGKTALQLALENERKEVFNFWQKYRGVNKSELNSLLLQAAKKGRIREVKKWLEWGADVNAPNKEGKTALQLAHENGYQDIVDFLHQRGNFCLFSLKGHSSSVNSVAFSPTEHVIATGSSDKTVKLWDAKTGEQLSSLQGHTNWVNSVTYSPDGGQIATGSADGTVKLWDAKTSEQLSSLQGHTGEVISVTYSPDGGQIATGSSDKTVKLWDAKTGEQLSSLQGHTGTIWSVTYSPDGGQIATGSRDNTVKLWDAKTGEQLSFPSGAYGYYMECDVFPGWWPDRHGKW